MRWSWGRCAEPQPGCDGGQPWGGGPWWGAVPQPCGMSGHRGSQNGAEALKRGCRTNIHDPWGWEGVSCTHELAGLCLQASKGRWCGKKRKNGRVLAALLCAAPGMETSPGAGPAPRRATGKSPNADPVGILTAVCHHRESQLAQNSSLLPDTSLFKAWQFSWRGCVTPSALRPAGQSLGPTHPSASRGT